MMESESDYKYMYVCIAVYNNKATATVAIFISKQASICIRIKQLTVNVIKVAYA